MAARKVVDANPQRKWYNRQHMGCRDFNLQADALVNAIDALRFAIDDASSSLVSHLPGRRRLVCKKAPAKKACCKKACCKKALPKYRPMRRVAAAKW